jgi:hypothetical protein
LPVTIKDLFERERIVLELVEGRLTPDLVVVPRVELVNIGRTIDITAELDVADLAVREDNFVANQ